jgi:hypothetical protein
MLFFCSFWCGQQPQTGTSGGGHRLLICQNTPVCIVRNGTKHRQQRSFEVPAIKRGIPMGTKQFSYELLFEIPNSVVVRRTYVQNSRTGRTNIHPRLKNK